MTTLVLKLAGPLQSWGTGSRFAYRHTDPQPSKSGVLGLLAAAQGRRRVDPLEDLLELTFGVRKDQPGRIVRDFQTAIATDGRGSMPLTHRYYLADAVFVAAVEGPSSLVEALATALHRPRYPLYLGRRSCPPAAPVFLSTRETPVAEILRSCDPSDGVAWAASPWWRRRPEARRDLEIVRDARPGEIAVDLVDDVPLSFDPDHRRYATRAVVHDTCPVPPGRDRSPSATDHDAWALFEEA